MSTATETCPPLEEIAAFLDGRLTGEERARAVAHLAECESCYEIFAGAARFQLDEEQEAAQKRESKAAVIPFPRRKAVFRWAAAIAAVLLVGVVTVSVNQPPAPLMAASLVSQELRENEQISQHLVPEAERGGNKPVGVVVTSPFEVLMGAHLIDLHIALARNDGRSIDILSPINGEIDEILGAQEEKKAFLEMHDQIYSGKAPKDFVARAEATEASLTETLDDSPYLALGKWLEASRLSAIAKQPGLFQERKNRRFLAWRLRHAEDDGLDPEVVGKLEQIQSILDESEAPTLPYKKLEALFEGILQHYQDEARAQDAD